VRATESVAPCESTFTLEADAHVTQVEEPGALLTSYEYTEFG
jgi:hypothetical protein